jgi:hypothetical protein
MSATSQTGHLAVAWAEPTHCEMVLFANYPLQRHTKQLAIYEDDVDVKGDRAIAGRSVLTFALSLPNATADSEAAVAALFDTNVNLGKNTVGCRFTSDTKVCPHLNRLTIVVSLCSHTRTNSPSFSDDVTNLTIPLVLVLVLFELIMHACVALSCV